MFRNNSARELSAFAESAMAVNRVVLQHMSINLAETHIAEEAAEAEVEKEAVVENDEEEDAPLMMSVSPSTKENVEPDSNSNTNVAVKVIGEKRKAPPFGLSPPSESKLMQRRKQSQSLIVIGSNNNSCLKESNNTTTITNNLTAQVSGKISSSFVNVADLVTTASPGLVESLSC